MRKPKRSDQINKAIPSEDLFLANHRVYIAVRMKTIEFYSGIGGWSSALNLSEIEHTIVAAFDINTVANEVYERNYGCKPSAKSLETITEKQLAVLDAELWVMSPPCQPYTRNNQSDNRDENDPRSKSFMRLIELIRNMKKPPMYIALENVVGFESSFCCQQFLEVLRQVGYTYEQYHLSPTQFGVPNERPRYYCIARRINAEEGAVTEQQQQAMNVIRTCLSDVIEARRRPLNDFLETTTSMTAEELVKNNIHFYCYF